DLSIVGAQQFEKDTLVAAKRIDVSANLISVIKAEDIKVSGIYLKQPRIKALVAQDGSANWDIVKPEEDASVETDTTSSEFQLQLKKYEIEDGYIYYNDKTSGLVAE